MTKRTPGPCITIIPESPQHIYDCGCVLFKGNLTLVQCPTHAAAPEMLALLKTLACIGDNDGPLARAYRKECDVARALLARIERGRP